MQSSKIVSLEKFKKEKAVGSFLLDRKFLIGQPQHFNIRFQLCDVINLIMICELLIERYAQLLYTHQECISVENSKHQPLNKVDGTKNHDRIFLYEIQFWRHWWAQLSGTVISIGARNVVNSTLYDQNDSLSYYVADSSIASFFKGFRNCIEIMNIPDGNTQVMNLCNIYLDQLQKLTDEKCISEQELLNKLYSTLQNPHLYYELFDSLKC
ncbi:hypothetical protein [Paenibacillus sp. Leaf72]|uniref:hypothetical protein n=1 Tax=Paenibacillus sp. Leaf72 TaxID=1736234 RepID=UPI0006F364BB|nr:hypothetical protein [Paenibacillus sp. Leaf72]KQN96954.1 hypothetical protein ASF12_23070 [Paenibacillus sp. Leaf72]